MTDFSNDTYAVQALRYWWNASPLSQVSVTNFSMAVDKYRASGTFMNTFGGTVKKYPQDRVKTAMEKLGRKMGASFPAGSDFFDALAAEIGSLTTGDVLSAAGSGVVDAGKFVGTTALDLGKSGLLIYVGIAAVGVFVLPKILAHLARGGK